MNKVRTQYTLVIGDFNAKIGKKLKREQAVGYCGAGDRSSRGAMLAEFAERNQLRVMNTLFKKRKNRKWTCKSRKAEKKMQDKLHAKQ